MNRKQQIVKVAAVQAAPVAFDLVASLKKLEHLTAEAASQGAELVAFPEGFLSAYPWRYAFDATIGAREARGMFVDMVLLEKEARAHKAIYRAPVVREILRVFCSDSFP
jgi:predicted amidohydrolase